VQVVEVFDPGVAVWGGAASSTGTSTCTSTAATASAGAVPVSRSTRVSAMICPRVRVTGPGDAQCSVIALRSAA
jgi:hypothetical protein